MSKEAMQKSIEKYENYTNILKQNIGKKIKYFISDNNENEYLEVNKNILKMGYNSCSLCDLYLRERSIFDECKKCPICKTVDDDNCASTPYEKIIDFLDSYRNKSFKVCEDLIKLFEDELNFLKKVNEEIYGK